MTPSKQHWVPLAKASVFREGKGKVFHLNHADIAVFKVGEDFRATDNSCPHQGGPLSEGKVEGEVVRCPWHDWRYDLRTGCPVLTPSLQTYPVRVNEGMVEVRCTVPAGGKAALEESSDTPLQRLLHELQVAVTLDQVVTALSQGLQAIVPHNRIGIALLDGTTDRLIQVKTRSDRHILLDDGFSASIRGSSLQRLLTGGDVRIIDDLVEILARRPSTWTRMLVDEGMRSNLTLPLQIQGRPMGVLFCSSIVPKAFEERHVAMLKQIAEQIAISIEKGHWVSDLARSNERYRILFEMLHEGVFTCITPESPLETIHPNLASWLQEEILALKERSLLSLLAPGWRAPFLQEVAQIQEVGDTRIFETALQKQDGQPLPIELRLTQIEQQGQQALMGLVRNLSEVKALNEQLHQQQSLGQLVGKNKRMRELYELAKKVAPLPTTVLITGQSGTGKELFARAIHDLSARREQPMLSVNCGALNESLLETEWFGHEKGAFTGAMEQRKGRFELAHQGTIFLDEVGELSPSTQVKLLRVLQEGEFERVGSSVTQHTDVRVIAATNRDLKAAVAQGLFREDLYYRLHVVQLHIPPLRERKDDIPLLLKVFIEKLNKSTNKSIQRVSEDALARLMAFDYPGNVRQLENIMEHAFVLCQSTIIELADLPEELQIPRDSLVELALQAAHPLAALERELILRLLETTDGNQQLVAQRLGISRTTLWRKMKAI